MTPSLPHTFRAWRRHALVFRHAWPAEVGPMFAEPVLVILAFGLGLSGSVQIPGVSDYVAFIAPGIIAGYAFFAAVFECTYGSYLRMEMRGLFQAMTATPVNLSDVVTAEICWGAARSVLSATAITVVVALFGYVHSPLALAIPLVGVAIGYVSAATSMVCTALAPSLTTFNYYFTLYVSPMFFFGGTFYPVESLPGWLEPIVWAMPVTPAVHATRGLTEGTLDWTTGLALAYLLALGALAHWAALRLMHRRLIK